ncbi:MAG: hypothetical protein WA637_15150 [Terriglobales bacterium]
MYLAVILGFCALTTPSVADAVVRAQLPELNQETPTPEAAPSGSPQESQPTTPATRPAQPSPESQPQPEATGQKPESKTPATKKTTSKKKHHHRKKAPSASSATAEKKVVRNGGTVDPVVQLAPTISAEQASSQRQSTTQLLATTDDNLKQIASRQLNPTQEDSVSQIRKYMEQAKTAEAAGDVERAHNLASKALLLSDDLVKH